MSREALEASANEVAEYANQCCHRSDGYEEDVAALVLAKLQAAQADAFERAAKVCDRLSGALDNAGQLYAREAPASHCALVIRALAEGGGR